VRGGVARNVAENMSLLGTSPFLISVVGEDVAGTFLKLLDSEKGRCWSTHFLFDFKGIMLWVCPCEEFCHLS
jgi:bifunctional ADP-heptose synthase (sugar kinase/adenylyltransferase)